MNILLKMLELFTGAYTHEDERNAEKGIAPTSNIGKYLQLISWGFELIQKNAELWRLWQDLDNAEGAVLDRHGKDFGVARGGADDEYYRLLIKVKLVAQLCGGNIDGIVAAVASLHNIEPEHVLLNEVFPAKVQIMVRESELSEKYERLTDTISALVKRFLVAGVGLDMIYFDEDQVSTEIFIGGAPVGTYEKIGLPNPEREFMPDPAELYLASHIVGTLERIALKTSKEV